MPSRMLKARQQVHPFFTLVQQFIHGNIPACHQADQFHQLGRVIESANRHRRRTGKY